MKIKNLVALFFVAFVFFVLIFIQGYFDLISFVCNSFSSFCLFFKIIYYSFLGFLAIDFVFILYRIFSEYYKDN